MDLFYVIRASHSRWCGWLFYYCLIQGDYRTLDALLLFLIFFLNLLSI
nr:MAG TPA: hypothetical protein [Caudoviricetes sp.]